MSVSILVSFLVAAALFSGPLAHADMIAISCSKNPLNSNSKSVAGMGSESLDPDSMEYVGADYRGKKFSLKATITTIRDRNEKIVRYIISEGNLTLVFSNLEKCGDSMEKPDDFAKLAVTKTVRGEKKVIERLACTCDID